MSFSASVDTSGVFGFLDNLTDVVENSARPAAQAGAQIFHDEARLRVPVSRKGHWFHGTSFKKSGQKYYFNPTTLRNSIYQVFSKDKSTDKMATYHIAWNRKKAPYGFMVEFGTSRAPAHPFLGPSFTARKNDAAAAMSKVVTDRIDEKAK